MTHKEVMVRRNVLITARCDAALKKIKKRHPLKKSGSALLEEAFWNTYTDPIERQEEVVKRLFSQAQFEKDKLDKMRDEAKK